MDSWRCNTAAIPASADRQREMKESILDVLLYLFEHYFTDDAAPPPAGTGFLAGDQNAVRRCRKPDLHQRHAAFCIVAV